MNPWQHPAFDKKIHHLITLVMSLCNTCGGVIFLIRDEQDKNVPMDVIERFQSRLTELILKKTGIQSQDKINFMQVPFCLGGQRPWTSIHLKSSKLTPCLNSESESMLSGLRTDLYGFIHIEGPSDHQHVEEEPSSPLLSQDILAIVDQAEDTTDTDGGGRNEQGTSLHAFDQETISHEAHAEYNSDDSTNLPEDFSILNKLDWSNNKKDWESYVHGETPNIETIINACSLWKPTTPMTVTPDKAELVHWFASGEDMDKTLSKVHTNEPGFAVVCKTWKFHISNSETVSPPQGHICDIVTVSSQCKICLWVICSHHNEESANHQIEYLLTTGRMIKHRIVQEAGYEDLSNLFVQCRLFCPNTSVQMHGAVSSSVKESLDMQEHIGHFYKDGPRFESLQRGFALVILSKESPLKRPLGNQTAITLSLQQLQVLSKRQRVNYICGPAGSGKSYTAALLCQMYGRDKCVYMCTTVGFVEYLRFSGYLFRKIKILSGKLKLTHSKTKHVSSLMTATIFPAQSQL